MMVLDTLLLGNSLEQWLTALGIALVINLMVGLCKVVALRRLKGMAQRTSTVADDVAVDVIVKTRQWLIFLVTIYIGSRSLELPERTDMFLRGVATVGAFLQAGLWFAALMDFFVNRSRDRAVAENPGAATSLAALSFLGRVVMWAALLLLTLANLGIDVTALVAGLGVGGIAVALAVQNILGDLFASLSIVIDKPFVIGDFIIVDEYMGTVEHVGLKTTRVRSLSGEQLVFSNGDLLKARLRNYKRMQERRAVFAFGVLYQTPAAQLARIPGIVRGIVESQPLARFDRAHFKSFGESSLDFEIVYWMRDPDYNQYMDAQQAINLAIVSAFEAEGVGFAYPTRSLFIEGPVRIERSAPLKPALNS